VKLFCLAFVLIGCAAPIEESDLSEPQDALEEDDDGKHDTACGFAKCGDPLAPNILFPGNPACASGGCERNLASASLYIPPRNGQPWGQTYRLGTEQPVTLAGYSSVPGVNYILAADDNYISPSRSDCCC
jgi:hypothetical protein